MTELSVLIRNAASCCHLKARAEAVTRWTDTSCARAAALVASRTCRLRSPPTANVSTLPQPPVTGGRHDPHPQQTITPLFPAPFSQLHSVLSVHFQSCSSVLVRLWPDLQAAWAPLPHSSTPVLIISHFMDTFYSF